MDPIVNKYKQEHRYKFGEMIQIWIKIMDKRIVAENSWYDFFGHYYERLSMTKQKGFAQYFTPDDICNFMVQILSPENRETLNEPTCGSGRFNLAAHSFNNKIFHVANDLDYTCAMMAACNFMVHGIKGVVTCEDGLWPGKNWRGAFIVNHAMAPCLEYVADRELVEKYIWEQTTSELNQYKHYMKLLMPAPEPIKPIIEIPEYNPGDLKPDANGQLSLF